MPYVDNGSAQARLWPCGSTDHGKTSSNIQFQTFYSRKEKSSGVAEETCHGLCSLGSRKSKRCKGDSESENDDDDDASSETGAEDEESIFEADEKEALRSFTLTSPTADEDTITPSSDEEDHQYTDDIRTSIDVLDVLKEGLARSHPESLRHRQVRHMLREEERKRSVQENFNRQQHLRRIDCLREKGVSTQNAEL